ncbi:MAG: outer membrane beta-barrel protein, partial [Cyclobacteriaceae bacterium]|nr:outer membrane beta-barrel protein [Cyclobacteriaceae bacterium]
MNKVNFLLAGLLSAFLCANVSAQKLTVSVSSGYGMPMAAQDYLRERTRDNTTDVVDMVKYSLGKGLNFNGSIGYNVKDNMELELGVGYLMGGKTVSLERDLRDPANHITHTREISATMLSFSPGMVFKMPTEGLQPYVKVAAIIGVPAVHSDYTYEDNVDLIVVNRKYYKGAAVGFSSAFGVNYDLGSLKLFGELFANSLSYSPSYGEITEYTTNGQDMLSTLDVKDMSVNLLT